MRYFGFVVLLLILVGCLPFKDNNESSRFFYNLEAARGEYVAARLGNTNVTPSESLRISVNGVEAELVSFNKQVAVFEVPQAVDGLTQSEGQVPVVISDGSNRVEGRLRILGDTEPGTFVALDVSGDFDGRLSTALQNLQERENGLFDNLRVVQEPSPEQFQQFRSTDIASRRQLPQLPDAPSPFPVDGERIPLINPRTDTDFDLQIDENISLLKDTNSPCTADLVTFTVAGVPLAELLEELEEVGLPGDGNSVGMGDQEQSEPSRELDVSQQDLPFTGRGATVAVLDSEIETDPDVIPSFQGNVLGNLGIDFVNEGGNSSHGTLVARAASVSAPDAQFMSVKVCHVNPVDEGTGVDCRADRVARGICHALVHAPDGPSNLVLNLSFGGPQDLSVHRLLLEHAADELDVSVAASAGNESSLGSPTHYPAAYSAKGNGIMAVAAYNEQDDEPFREGTEGPFIDITALGESTSYSSPRVAGAMAVLKEAGGLSSAEIKSCLINGVDESISGTSDQIGAGLLSISGALSACF